MTARQTVCPPVVGLETSNVAWHDAEHAAAVGAVAISPYKKGSPDDRCWLRHYHIAKECIRRSGFTQMGIRAA